MSDKNIHIAFLFLLALLLYSNTLHHGYVLDDSLFVTGNSFTKKGIDGIAEIWTNDAFVGAHGKSFDLTGGRYRPLSLTFFAIEYELFGLNPLPSHLFNILLFALTAVMLYVILLKMLPKQNEWIPLIVSVLFVIHPIHTEVVANIKSRDELLAFFFLLLTFYFVFQSLVKKQYIIIAALCYLLSLLSKENTITAIAIIPLTLLFFSPLTIKQLLIKTIPFVIAATCYLLLRSIYTDSGKVATNLMDNPYMLASFWDKYATVVMVCGKYLQLLLFPYPLSFDYSYNQIPVISWNNWKPILSLLLYIGMLTYALYNTICLSKLKKKPTIPSLQILISYGLLFYLITFSIVSNVFFNIGAPMGERFVYLPSLGICIAFAAIVVKLLEINLKEKISYALKWVMPFMFLIPIASWATYERNKAWENNFILYKTDIQTVPNSARARLFYGLMLFNKYEKVLSPSLLDSAIEQMEVACQINPDFYHAFYNKGIALQAKNDHKAAIQAFETVLKIEPMHINAHYYLGLSYGKGLGQFDKAIEFMEKGVKYGYNGSDSNMNLGVAYGIKGDYEKAVKILKQGIEKYPNNAQLHLNLAITYGNMAEKELSEQHFQKAFTLNPELKR